MRLRDWGPLVAAGAMAAVGVLTLPLAASATVEPSPTTSQSPSPTEAPEGSGVVEIDDAVFTWSVSEQTNAQSHNPLTNNFLAAGEANPGRGGMVLASTKWKAKAGDVEIQKRTSGGDWKRATWQGLGTDASGAKIGLYGPFSGHRVRIGGGTGTLSPADDDATLQWQGTFTVVYYGGNTVFTLTDPLLTVVDGVGRLSATGGGWASDRNDPTVWKRVKPQLVPVVEVRNVDVTETGLKVTPEYAGVSVVGPESQARTGDRWGAFPQEFVTFLEPMGASQFWYSTGLQSDWTKEPEPIAVGWQGSEPEDPKPSPTPPATTPENPVNRPPDPTPSVPPEVAAPALPPSPPLSGLPVTQSDVPLVWGAPAQVTAATAAGPVTDQIRTVSSGSQSAAWFGGGVLLLGAAALLLVPTPRRPH